MGGLFEELNIERSMIGKISRCFQTSANSFTYYVVTRQEKHLLLLSTVLFLDFVSVRPYVPFDVVCFFAAFFFSQLKH